MMTVMQGEWEYYANLSGLTPVFTYSLSDHKLAYFRSILGDATLSLTDATVRFYMQATGLGDALLARYTYVATQLVRQGGSIGEMFAELYNFFPVPGFLPDNAVFPDTDNYPSRSR